MCVGGPLGGWLVSYARNHRWQGYGVDWFPQRRTSGMAATGSCFTPGDPDDRHVDPVDRAAACAWTSWTCLAVNRGESGGIRAQQGPGFGQPSGVS